MMVENPDVLGAAISVALIMPLYGFILFMISRAAESRLATPKNDSITELLE